MVPFVILPVFFGPNTAISIKQDVSFHWSIYEGRWSRYLVLDRGAAATRV